MLFRKTLSCIECGNVFEVKDKQHLDRCKVHREPVAAAQLRKEAILAWAEQNLDAVEKIKQEQYGATVAQQEQYNQKMREMGQAAMAQQQSQYGPWSNPNAGGLTGIGTLFGG